MSAVHIHTIVCSFLQFLITDVPAKEIKLSFQSIYQERDHSETVEQIMHNASFSNVCTVILTIMSINFMVHPIIITMSIFSIIGIWLTSLYIHFII